MSTTKFEITMVIEVTDIAGIPASPSVLSITKAIENISSGDGIKVAEIAVETIERKPVATKPFDAERKALGL